MTKSTPNHDEMIYQEMMSHPILFSHIKPRKIAIVGDTQNTILEETLKHDTLSEIWHIHKDAAKHQDKRVQHQKSHINEWINQAETNYFDALIIAENTSDELFPHFFKILNNDGILLQQSDSFFQVEKLKKLHDHFKAAGFSDALPLHFPQPNFSSGLRAAMMGKKNGILKKVREKDIFNKTFSTHYYNFDIHKAALVVPEFMREELIK